MKQAARQPRYVPRWTAIAAGLVAMAVAGFTSYRSFVKEENTPVSCIAAAHDHEQEIVKGEPHSWTRDLAGIGLLAQSQDIPESAITALGSVGYRLERGRVCLLEGQSYLHLVYRGPHAVFSVYLRLRDKDPLFRDSVRERSIGIDKVAFFQAGGLNAICVARASPQDVMAFAGAGLSALKSAA